ncbi:hypothetical protein BD779DRAFT_1641617 [Infundibulicybe gibba]|nr:hypothetical protein BD779DRAFT_1641617 [Infundibulicybe gibba]
MIDITSRMLPDVAASVAQRQQEIDRLRVIRNDLLAQLAAVEANLCSAEVERAKILNYHAPIFSIPTELFSMIIQAGQSDGEGDTAQTKSRLPFEVLATHICSRLRQVVIGTRTLWSFIHVAPGQSMERLRTYLMRSEGSPLDVRVELRRGLCQSKVPMDIIDMVLDRSRSWRRFTFETSQEEVQHPIVGRLCHLDAPFLEYISLCVSGLNQLNPASFHSSYHDHHPRILLNGTPNLSFIRLRGIAMYLFRPQLTSVKTLHIDQTRSLPLPHHVFVHVLTASPHLTHLSIFGDVMGPAGWATHNPQDSIYLPSLRSLRVCGVRENSYSGLLLAVNAPLLESLVLKGVHEHDLDSLCISSDATKFSCLQSLTFCDFELSQIAYMRLFSLLPMVVTFETFFASPSTPTIFQLLGNLDQGAGYMGNHIPWPRLRNITCLLDPGDQMLIEKTVKSRRDHGCPLSRLRFGTVDISASAKFQLGSDIIIEEFGNIDQWCASHNHDHDDDLFS